MYDFETTRAERLGRVLKITLDNPRNELNAVDAAMHADLVGLFAELKHEREARAVLLTANGRAFSAGGDLNWLESIEASDLPRMQTEGKQLIWNLLDVEIPIVACLDGHAVGLGATLALACDAVFMREDAKLADPHVNVGLVAGDGGTIFWPLAIGPMLAKRFLLTGDPLTGAEAAQLGLVTYAGPSDEVRARALAFAERLASQAPLAVRHTKLAINQLVKQTAVQAFDYATAMETATLASRDHREALRALREKTSPDFQGH